MIARCTQCSHAAVGFFCDVPPADFGETVIRRKPLTNRKPPAEAEAVPLAHRAQLAIYREILKPLYPGTEIDCVLVYTEATKVVTLPVELMARSLAELKTK